MIIFRGIIDIIVIALGLIFLHFQRFPYPIERLNENLILVFAFGYAFFYALIYRLNQLRKWAELRNNNKKIVKKSKHGKKEKDIE